MINVIEAVLGYLNAQDGSIGDLSMGCALLATLFLVMWDGRRVQRLLRIACAGALLIAAALVGAHLMRSEWTEAIVRFVESEYRIRERTCALVHDVHRALC